MNGRNRRRKDVPFNPFAQNAAAERNRRHAEKAKEKRRLESQNQSTSPIGNSAQAGKVKTLEDLQRQAREKLAVDMTKTESAVHSDEPTETTTLVEPIVEPKPTITEKTAAKPAVVKSSREDRLAELKRKSQKSKDNAKLSQSAGKSELKPELTIDAGDTSDSDDQDNDSLEVNEIPVPQELINKNLNVFKTIQSVDKSSAGISKKKRKSRRIDKKGGGRQRLEKKLNRQKILEFKYVAREILAHPDVPEEHRSNVLGQIIAKGERISIDSAIEFIDLKNAELILTDEIAERLKQEIKSISTRR